MGSWNKTCGISRLHIEAGTPVYVFVLEENMNKTERCYSTSFWRPVLLPFNSVYDDYGSGEDNSGPALQYIVDGITKNLVELEQGDNKYHDIPVRKEGFTIDKFFEAVRKNRLSVDDGRGKAPIVDFVMLRKDVVDHILDNRTIQSYVGENKGTAGWNNAYIEYKFADIISAIPAFVDNIILKLQERVDELDEFPEHLKRKYAITGGLDEFINFKDPNLASKFMGTERYKYSKLVNFDSIVFELIHTDRKAAEVLIAERIKAVYINSFMESTRNNWAPGGHEGSQSSSSEDYVALINAMQAMLTEENAQYARDNEY